MRPHVRLPAVLVAVLVWPAGTLAQSAGPSVEIAPEHATPSGAPAVSVGAGTAPDHELVRGMVDQRFRSAGESNSSTAIGGYGEIRFSGTTQGEDAEREWVADIQRLVLFVAHGFNDRFRFYSELEVE